MPKTTTPPPGARIVPLHQLVRVQGDDWHGTAICAAFSDTGMQYLVVLQSVSAPPVWVDETEVRAAGMERD
jgi:hypothetical protein